MTAKQMGMWTRILFSVVLTVAVATAKPAPAGLNFALRYRAEEKLLGAPLSTRESVAPEVREIATYISPRLENGLIRVLRDRDLDVVRFELEFSKWDNGGNDPRTGRAWAMPAAFVNAALRLFAVEWKQAGPRELRAKDGSMRAVVGDSGVTVTAL